MLVAAGSLNRKRPGELLVARRVEAVCLLGIAVDQRPGVERVAHAAHLVLDREQHAPRVEIDDVLEAVLVLVALLGDEVALQQAAIGAGEIGQVDGDVVAFLSWVADPRLEERKRMGLLVIGYLLITAVLFGFAKRRIWSSAH